MGTQIRDRDNGYRKMIAALDASKNFSITVGIHAEEGEASDGKASVIEVAEWAEFGTETEPARPFVSSWADDRGPEVVKELAEDGRKALKLGKSVAMRADQRAQQYAGEIQNRIADGIPPPNAPSTIAQKGSSTPLINKGQLRASVRGKVEGK